MPLSGYSKANDCGRKPSSLVSIKIATTPEVNSINYDSDTKRFNAITMEPGTPLPTFHNYEFKNGEAELKIDPIVENGITKYVPRIVLKAEKLSDSTLDMVDEFAKHSYCGMIAVCETFYGEHYVIGYDSQYAKIAPLELAEGSLTSGRGLTGEQGGDIALSCEMPNRPRLLADNVIVPLPS